LEAGRFKTLAAGRLEAAFVTAVWETAVLLFLKSAINSANAKSKLSAVETAVFLQGAACALTFGLLPATGAAVEDGSAAS
jgi:hypothetical protein